MVWESRGGRRRYFYRVDRVDGRVRRTYFGAGVAATLAAGLVAEGRAAKAAESAILRAERVRMAPAERAIVALDDGAGLLLAAALTSAGFHRHDRGAWRRKRVQARD